MRLISEQRSADVQHLERQRRYGCGWPVTGRQVIGRKNRAGTSIIELLACFGILSLLLVFAGQWSSAMLQHRRNVEQKRLAMDATANVATLVMATNYEDLSLATIQTLATPYTPGRYDWDIALNKVAIENSELRAKQIVLSLNHQNPKCKIRPVVTWKYPLAKSGGSDAQP